MAAFPSSHSFHSSMSPFRRGSTSPVLPPREGSPVLCRTPSPTILTVEINGKELNHEPKDTRTPFFAEERAYVRDSVDANPNLDNVHIHLNHTCPHSVSMVSALADALRSRDVTVDVHFSSVTEKGLTSLQGLFEDNVPLNGVNLSFASIGNEGLKIIAQGLSDNLCVERLNLDQNGIDEEGVEYLTKVIESSNGSLLKVSLNDNCLREQTIEPVQVYAFTPPVKVPISSVVSKLENLLARNQLKQAAITPSLTTILLNAIFSTEQAAKEKMRQKEQKSWALYQQASLQMATFPFLIQFERLSSSSLRALEWIIQDNPSMTELNLKLKKGSKAEAKKTLCNFLKTYPQLTSLGPILDTKERYHSRLARNALLCLGT